MARPIHTVLFCGLLAWQCAGATQSIPQATLALRNVVIVSAQLEAPTAPRDVLIHNGRILAIVDAGSGYSALRSIEARGKFLIPGLIDSHVHLAHNPLLNHAAQMSIVELQLDYRRQLPRSFLYHGFTTLVDLDYAAKRSGWLPETVLAPAVYHCGRGVRVAGGYGPAFVPPERVARAFPNLVYEPAQHAHWPPSLNPLDYTIDAAVQRVLRSGAICLKTYVESGFGGVFDWPNQSPAGLAALTARARAQGLTVVMHANSAAAWQAASTAGADVIAHGLWHWQGDRREARLTADAESAIATAATAGLFVQPTQQVVKGERHTLEWNFLSDPRLAEVLPATLLGYLQSDRGSWSRDQLRKLYQLHNPYPDSSPMALIEVSVQRAAASLLLFHRSGGRLLLGSDTPAQDGIGNPPGLNGLLEIQSWARAGIPLARIFEAATLANARAFGLEQELGSIEVGKQADLLLLDTNPLLDIAAYDAIDLVIIDGQPIARDSLSARHLTTARVPD